MGVIIHIIVAKTVTILFGFQRIIAQCCWHSLTDVSILLISSEVYIFFIPWPKGCQTRVLFGANNISFISVPYRLSRCQNVSKKITSLFPFIILYQILPTAYSLVLRHPFLFLFECQYIFKENPIKQFSNCPVYSFTTL